MQNLIVWGVPHTPLPPQKKLPKKNTLRLGLLWWVVLLGDVQYTEALVFLICKILNFFSGILDQGQGVLIVFEDSDVDQTYTTAL